jgi:hypothetical protein
MLFSMQLNVYLLFSAGRISFCCVLRSYERSLRLVLFCIFRMGSVCCYLVFNSRNASNIGFYTHTHIYIYICHSCVARFIDFVYVIFS